MIAVKIGNTRDNYGAGYTEASKTRIYDIEPREGECKVVDEEDHRARGGSRGGTVGCGVERKTVIGERRQTAVLSLWVHCGGSRLLASWLQV